MYGRLSCSWAAITIRAVPLVGFFLEYHFDIHLILIVQQLVDCHHASMLMEMY
jgi:hypothetical protein